MNNYSPDQIESTLQTFQDNWLKDHFLRELYKSGNQYAAKLLIEKWDGSAIENELEKALTAQDQILVKELWTKMIQYYLNNKFHILLRDKLKAFGNKDMITTTMSSLEYNDIDNNRYLIEEFGSPNQKKELWEALLKDSINWKYWSSSVGYLRSLNRFDEAINLCLSHYKNGNNYTLLGNAWNIANEHCEWRKKEVANIVWITWAQEHNERLLYDCANFLGKTSELRAVIAKHVKQLPSNRYMEPRYSEEIAYVMNHLGWFESDIMRLSSALETYVKSSTMMRADACKEMARFYQQLNDAQKSLDWFNKALTYEIKNCHPSHAEITIKEIEELYPNSDPVSPELRYLMLEKNGKYVEAASLAEKLWDQEKANSYRIAASVLKPTWE